MVLRVPNPDLPSSKGLGQVIREPSCRHVCVYKVHAHCDNISQKWHHCSTLHMWHSTHSAELLGIVIAVCPPRAIGALPPQWGLAGGRWSPLESGKTPATSRNLSAPVVSYFLLLLERGWFILCLVKLWSILYRQTYVEITDNSGGMTEVKHALHQINSSKASKLLSTSESMRTEIDPSILLRFFSSRCWVLGSHRTRKSSRHSWN